MKHHKNILLAGLAEREAAAVQMMVESTWRDSSCVFLPRQADFQMPKQSAAAQACQGAVVNLLGVGLLRHSAEAEAKLRDLLAGRSAVLLLHSGDSTWAAAQWQQAPGQTLIFLTPPCSSEALRTAIRQCGILAAASAPVSPRQALAPPPDTPLKTPSSIGTPPPTRPPPQGYYSHMGNGALEHLERALPALQRSDWLGLIKKALGTGGSSRFHIGPTAFVMDMQAGWLASALPSSTLQKMLHTPQLLASVQMQALPQDTALEAAGQDFGSRLPKVQKALDMLTWDLSSEALKTLTLNLEQDLSLRLRRYPNFTQLERLNPLDMQLATLCALAPRSLRELQRLFAQYEQEVLRFAVLSVLSGLAVIAPSSAQQTSTVAKVAVGSDSNKRNFFKALLGKLF